MNHDARSGYRLLSLVVINSVISIIFAFLLTWLSAKFSGMDFLSHDAGHLPEMILGWRSKPHLGPFHIASDILILGGFVMLPSAWGVLYKAQQERRLRCSRTLRPHEVSKIWRIHPDAVGIPAAMADDTHCGDSPHPGLDVRSGRRGEGAGCPGGVWAARRRILQQNTGVQSLFRGGDLP